MDPVAASDSASHLEHLDGFARRLLARASPVRFDVVRSLAERDAVFRLRFDTVVDQGWATPEVFPDRLEHDAYDLDAVHVAGWDGLTLATAARLVFPWPGRLLPTEEEFDVRVEPANAVADIGRGIVAPAYRAREHTVFAGLLARCWIEVRARGLKHLCGAATPARLERYRQFGLPLRVLGASRMYWGEERTPVFLDGVELARVTLGL
jgi:hypothetical protein